MKNKTIKSIIYFPVRVFLFVYYILESIYLLFKKTNIILEDKKEEFESNDVNDFRVISQPYQFMIENTSDTEKEAVLFGCAEHILTKNFGSDEGIIVKSACSNISYLRMLFQSAINPFMFELMRLQSNDKDNLEKIGKLFHADANGHSMEIPIILKEYFNAYQFQTSILDINKKVKIDLNTEIRFKVNPKTTIVVTIFPSEKQTDDLGKTKNIPFN